MLTRLFCLAALLLAVPPALLAYDLTPTQEATCREIGKITLAIGEARDIPMPRPLALQMIETAMHASPENVTLFTGVVYWVYDHPELRGTELYLPAVTDCRQEFQRRHETDAKALMRNQMATICASQANIGVALAAKARTMTQLQAFRMLQEIDPDYASKVADYAKLVPFVYQRRRMAPEALRVAVTQHCQAGLQADLKQQYGVELEQGWRR